MGEGVRIVQAMEEEIGALTNGRPANTQIESDDEHDVDPVDIWFRAQASAEVEQAWQVAERLFGRIAAEARQHGAELWLASIGHPLQENPNAAERTAYLESHGYRITAYSEERFGALARREGVPYLDMSPRLLAFAERNHVSVRGFFNTGPNQGHWNEVGNAAAADIVASELLEYSAVIRSVRTKSLKERQASLDR